MDLAEFSGTTLYTGRRRHPQHGLIGVLGYQNTAVNLAAGPNAMLLHLPAASMTPDHFISVGRGSNVLDRMVDAVRPAPGRGAAAMDWMSAGSAAVQVFEHDIYTVLLAADPIRIPEALHRVAYRRRPRLNPALLEFYADCYPGHTVALCCFDNADAERAKPLLMWYTPTEPDLLAAPAVDCHTGEPPSLEGMVETDHWVIFGSDDAPEGWGEPVEYPHGIRHTLRDFLPETVMGAQFTDPMPNGDFAISHDDLLDGRLSEITRLQPVR